MVEQQTALREVLHYLLVGVLDELSGEGIVAGDDSLQVYRLYERQLFLSANTQVLVTEGGSDVDYARAVVQRYKGCRDDGGRECVAFHHLSDCYSAGPGSAHELLYFRAVFEGMVKRCVAKADQVGALYRAYNLVVLLDVDGNQGLGQYQPVAVAVFFFQFNDAVISVFVHRQARVARQRPRSSGPRQQEHISLVSAQSL